MATLNEKTLFPILQVNNLSDWEKLANLTDGCLTSHGMRILRDVLGTGTRSIIVEREYVDKDYRDTYSNFYSKKFSEYPSKTIRLHFFRQKLVSKDIFRLKTKEDQYTGYSVIRPTGVNCIGRTILDPRKLNNIHGCMCLSDNKVHLLGDELNILGFPYISQDTDVTICAHAACWMVFRYFSQEFCEFREVYPFQISQMTNDFSLGRLVPSRGITIGQAAEIFSSFGFYPEVYMRDTCKDPHVFHRVLYYYIESGIPVLAGLGKHNHAVTLFGHVSDYHTNHPGHLFNSFHYLKGLIGNDDNCSPYQTLPLTKGRAGFYNESNYSVLDIDRFVVPLYEKIYLSAEFFESLVLATLKHDEIGIEALSGVNLDDLVFRIVLTSSKRYKSFRRKNPLASTYAQNTYLQMLMPKFIWVCELSTPDLYKQGKILGEVLWDATACHIDRFSFLALHYPGVLLMNAINAVRQPRKRFELLELEKDKAYDLFVGNMEDCT